MMMYKTHTHKVHLMEKKGKMLTGVGAAVEHKVIHQHGSQLDGKMYVM